MTAKNHEIRVKLNVEELEKIKRKAKASGMSMSGYLRYLGLNTTIKVIIEE